MSKKLTVYHGSSNVIEIPKFGAGKPYNDYGLGFYCTESIELAKEWACSVESDGFANQYTLDMSGLSVLQLTNGEYHILNWLAVLLENRKFRIGGEIAQRAAEYIAEHFMVDYKHYDVIIGYRADDSYFSFASAFLNNTISLPQLESAMVLGKLGEQVVVKSERAFDSFDFTEAFVAPKELYYPKKLARDTNAREEFKSEKNKGLILSDKYILDIIREGWHNDDKRLQRVVLR